jgi:hypothetical protein
MTAQLQPIGLFKRAFGSFCIEPTSFRLLQVMGFVCHEGSRARTAEVPPWLCPQKKEAPLKRIWFPGLGRGGSNLCHPHEKRPAG